MNTTVKFTVIYLIPVVSFVIGIGVFALSFGNSSGEKVIGLADVPVIAGFIASSVIAVQLISYFKTGDVNYLGIAFSVVAWLLELVVVIIYLAVFHQFLNP